MLAVEAGTQHYANGVEEGQRGAARARATTLEAVAQRHARGVEEGQRGAASARAEPRCRRWRSATPAAWSLVLAVSSENVVRGN